MQSESGITECDSVTDGAPVVHTKAACSDWGATGSGILHEKWFCSA
jgi:hypothetical protein